jgi:CheY-like chemotaxis protein
MVPKPQIVLLIQDDVRGADIIRDVLKTGGAGAFQIVWVRHCAAGLERLASKDRSGATEQLHIAAILLDLSTSAAGGIGAFDACFRAAPQIPILMMCAENEEEIAKTAVIKGAQDYLLKDHIDSYSLPKAIQSMIERVLQCRSVFRTKRARAGDAQFDRRCRHHGGFGRARDLSESRRRIAHGMAASGRRSVAQSRTCFGSSMVLPGPWCRIP